MKRVMVALFLVFLLLPVLGTALGDEPSVVDASTQTSHTNELAIIPPPLDTHRIGDPFTFSVQVFDTNGSLVTGTGTSCRLTIYNNTGTPELETSLANSTFYYTALINDTLNNEDGQHAYSVWCNQTSVGGYLSGIFILNPSGQPIKAYNGDFGPLWTIILLPLILVLIMLGGAITLDAEEHGALKIGLFLLSSIPFFLSTWFGTIIVGRYYEIPELINAMGDSAFIVGIVFFVLLLYFIAFFIYVSIKHTAEDKQARLKY
jgi:hypothetical protein